MSLGNLNPAESEDITIFRAMGRAQQRWSVGISAVDAEQAYLDRTLMATEIIRLQRELAATQDSLDEAEREVESLGNALNNIDFE